MPASDQATPILPGLSPIRGREIEARFDGALMSSDGGLLVLRETEQRLGIARRPPVSCVDGPLDARTFWCDGAAVGCGHVSGLDVRCA